MLGPYDYALWLIGFAAEAFILVRGLARRDFFRYFTLHIYILALILKTVGEYFVFLSYGFDSKAYTYFYYYSDCTLTVFFYLVVMGLYDHVFSDMHASKYVRGGAWMLLGATAAFSYVAVFRHVDHLTSRFVVELSQNLYFVGVVLTWLLWASVLQLKESRLRIIQLVLSMGVFVSAQAATYALRLLFPQQVAVWHKISPLMGLFLVLAWVFTFTRVAEEARLATARVAPHNAGFAPVRASTGGTA